MKVRGLLLFVTAVLIFAACKKNDMGCASVSPDSEAASITAFCNELGIAFTVDSNGIYYQIIDPGSGETASLDSVVTVTYTTSLLSGDIIDDHSDSAISLPLNQFIEGWRIAIPYIQEGGHIKMVIPSALAYGCTGIAGLVPPDSPLYYDVVLIKVSN
jgi:FKBP-type peptidyl-prolyl cis-trans isomerase FkpA